MEGEQIALVNSIHLEYGSPARFVRSVKRMSCRIKTRSFSPLISGPLRWHSYCKTAGCEEWNVTSSSYSLDANGLFSPL
jgi:hypothetical protein